jgi:large subunit ribosomal protein L13
MVTSGKTYVAKPGNADRQWVVVNADGQTLGRLASKVAAVLRGKNKATFTPHIDTGDYVIVVNAEKIRVTGKKMTDKLYQRHTGYPGGFRETDLQTMLQKNPRKVIELAVRGMLPHNRLGRRLIRKLHVYAGDKHPHEAQRPTTLQI